MLLIGPDPDTENPDMWTIHGQAGKAVRQWAKPHEEARIQRLSRFADRLRQGMKLTLWVLAGVAIAAIIKADNPGSWMPMLLCALTVGSVYFLLSALRSLVLIRLNDAKRRMAK